METPDDVREAKIHSISLQRPRGKRRSSAQKAAPAPPPLTTRITATLKSTLDLVLTPPTQSLYALVGISSFTVKATGRSWRALVEEGAEVTSQITGWAGEVVRRATSPFAGRAKQTPQSGSADA